MTKSELIESIKLFEGFRATPYKDTGGTLTIGYGRITDIKPNEVTTKEREHAWLVHKVDGIETEIKKCMTAWGYEISDNQLYALVDFVYNLGIGNLNKLTDNGKRTLNTIGDKILLYCTCKGETLQGLVKRRTWEHNLFKTGATTTKTTNYTAKDVQRFANDLIHKHNLSIKMLDEDGIIGQKTINAVVELFKLL